MQRLAASVTIGAAALKVLAALGMAAGIGACFPRPAYEAPRLVIVYAPCTVSRQYMQPYNGEAVYTPNFAAFGQRAAVFDRHHTEAGQSGIAYASLLSGGQADVHHVFKHPRKLADELVLLPEIFEAAGYDMFSWMVHPMASSRLNYGQGVPDDQESTTEFLEADDPVFAKMLARLDSDPDYKAFVITNFTVTHGPYKGVLLDEFCSAYPAECTTRGDAADVTHYQTLSREQHRLLSVNYPNAVKELALSAHDEKRLRETKELMYKADMYRLDKLFGAVVDAVDDAGVFDESLIAFTSDHGEMLWRENSLFKWWHGYQLVQEVTNISLLVSGPNAGVPAGRYPGVSSSIDVASTLAGLAGAPLPADFTGTGIDLSSAVRGEQPPPDQIAYSHSALAYAPLRARRMQLLSSLFPGPDPAYMWVTARRGDEYYKLTRSPDDAWAMSMYDLSTDPGETTDLYDADSSRQAEVVTRMYEYKEYMREAGYGAVGRSRPRAETIEMLRRLGYID
jgi:arylsulfatase A-like enzyme